MKKIIKKGSILALGTVSSRILGLVRDLVLAFFLGTSDYMEAFLVAFRIPNVLRSLLAEEAVDAVTVPLISPYKNDKYFNILSGRLLRLAGLFLLVFVFLGIILAPFLLRVVAPGFYAIPDKAQLTVESLRIVFGYLLFVGLSAHSAGVLFVRGRYFAPAFTPILLNLFLIAAAFLSFARGLNPVYTLSFAVMGAGLLQLICHLWVARDSICLWERGLSWFADDNLKKAFKLFLPRIWSVAVYHVNVLLIDTMLASFASIVGNGAVAALYFANRFVQLPLAVVGLSISRAALPDLAAFAANEQEKEFVETLSFVIVVVLTLIVPVAALFLFLPDLFIGILASGSFVDQDISRVSLILAAYSPGILFYALNRILTHAFYAYKDTKTPAWAATISLLVNIALSIAFMFIWQAAGLAVASSVAAFVQFIYLYRVLSKRVALPLKTILAEMLKIVPATAMALLVLSFINWQSLSEFNRFLPLLVLMPVTLLVYGSMAKVFRFRMLDNFAFLVKEKNNA